MQIEEKCVKNIRKIFKESWSQTDRKVYGDSIAHIISHTKFMLPSNFISNYFRRFQTHSN